MTEDAGSLDSGRSARGERSPAEACGNRPRAIVGWITLKTLEPTCRDAPIADCLDAETVAAWMDGGLDAAGVAAAEAHASTCERCQALLATVVKRFRRRCQHPRCAAISGSPACGDGGSRRWPPLQPRSRSGWSCRKRRLQSPPAAADRAATTWRPATQARAPRHRQPRLEAPAAAPSGARRREAQCARQRPSEEQNKLADSAATRTDAARDRYRRQSTSQTRGRQREARREMRQADTPAAAAPTAAAAAEAAAERMREAPAAPTHRRGHAAAQTSRRRAIVSPDPNSRWRVTAPGTVRAIGRRRAHLDRGAHQRQGRSAGRRLARPLSLVRGPQRPRAARHRRHEFHTAALPRIRRSRRRHLARRPHRHGHHGRRPHLPEPKMAAETGANRPHASSARIPPCPSKKGP